jgi:hypothetical protein
MEYTEVVTPPIRWAPEKAGEFIEGTFAGAEEVEGPHGFYMRYFIDVNDKRYWISSASLRDAYGLLDRAHKKQGTPWKIECTYIDDFTLSNARICHYQIHAGSKACRAR